MWLRWARLAGRFLSYSLAGYAAWLALMLPLYRFVDPPLSNLMLLHAVQGDAVSNSWTPLSRISPALLGAVLASEDANYCQHWGVDWGAVREAMQHNGGGASTIPMQTVKNLFLWNGKTVLRKVPEVPLAYAANLIWGKPRLLEIYLNIAEWGPGIFGVEAASQHYFHTSAATLTSHQASLLAAVLPNPIRRDAGNPGAALRSHAASVRRQLNSGPNRTACVLP